MFVVIVLFSLRYSVDLTNFLVWQFEFDAISCEIWFDIRLAHFKSTNWIMGQLIIDVSMLLEEISVMHDLSAIDLR